MFPLYFCRANKIIHMFRNSLHKNTAEGYNPELDYTICGAGEALN
jgi:hypothetical protein